MDEEPFEEVPPIDRGDEERPLSATTTQPTIETQAALEQRIKELEEQITRKKQLEELKQRVQELEREAQREDTPRAERRRRSSSTEYPEPKKQRSGTYVLRPQELRTYYGKSVREHQEWFNDTVDTIEASAAYFPDDPTKVQYALRYVAAEPKST